MIGDLPLNRRAVIIGGGTFSHVRAHLAIAAPAFGGTARALHALLPGSELLLTRMAGGRRDLVTNADLARLLDALAGDPAVGAIVLSAALCDYDGTIGDTESGVLARRLRTAEGAIEMRLTPAPKLIGRVRAARDDLYLVGFKTTTHASVEEQRRRGSHLLRQAGCSAVLANDLTTLHNLVLTADGGCVADTSDRAEALAALARQIERRLASI